MRIFASQCGTAAIPWSIIYYDCHATCNVGFLLV